MANQEINVSEILDAELANLGLNSSANLQKHRVVAKKLDELKGQEFENELKEALPTDKKTAVKVCRIKIRAKIYRTIRDSMDLDNVEDLVLMYLDSGKREDAAQLLIDMDHTIDDVNVEYDRLVRKYLDIFTQDNILDLIRQGNTEENYQLGVELANDKGFMKKLRGRNKLDAEMVYFICQYFDLMEVETIEFVLSKIKNYFFVSEGRYEDNAEYALLFIWLVKNKSPDNKLVVHFIERFRSDFKTDTDFYEKVFHEISYTSREYKNIEEREYRAFWLKFGVRDLDLDVGEEFGKAIIKFSKSATAKRELFEGAKCLGILKNPQAWITINEPEKAVRLFDVVLSKAKDKKDVIYKLISKFLGRNVKQLEASDFDFYADEIIDGLNEFIGNSKLKDDEEISEILGECKFGFRYIRRSEDDLRMGSKTGDCTAPGSINFKNSLSWQINPAYQVIKLQKGGRFLGRVNATLGAIGKDECIFVDAVEFNPQAQEKGMPYYEDACLVFKEAIEHIRLTAKAEGRKLMLYQFSNSSDFETVLEKKGLELRDGPKTMATFTFVNAFEDVKKVLVKIGFDEKISLWYQMMDASIQGSATDLKDKIAARLEREVFNPGQIAHPEIAVAMREHDFDTAAGLFVQIYAVEIGKIFEIEGVGAELIKRKLGQLYKLSEGISGHRVVLNCSKFSEVL